MAKETDDATKRKRLDGILAPLHEHAAEQGYTDEYLAGVIKRARAEVAATRNKLDGP